MGNLIRVFTFDRNTLKENALQSAIEVEQHIKLAVAGGSVSKVQSNIIGALRSYMGVLDGDMALTPVGEKFLHLYAQNREDAWRWLLTRSLWLYVVPNGTLAHSNAIAREIPVSFAFFRQMIGLLIHLSALPGDERFLYYEELCVILNDDANWSLGPHDLFNKVLRVRTAARAASSPFPPARLLLGDLEHEYDIRRDNFNTVVNKAFRQTGLFEYKRLGGGISRATGIALAVDLDAVLQRRIRVITDTDVSYPGKSNSDWLAYLQSPPKDLPEEVSFAPTSIIETDEPDENLNTLITEAAQAFDDAGLRIDSPLIRRFAASLLAKRFVILTGLSGSGKTKLAQAFAQWIAPRVVASPSDVFRVGQTLTSEVATYTIEDVTDLTIEIVDSTSSRRMTLPLEMVRAAADAVESASLDETATTAEVAAVLKTKEIFDDSLVDVLAAPLKAAVFAGLEARSAAVPVRHYEVIPVGADWSGKENILGYADALTPGQYVRTTTAVDLILRAAADLKRPYFLILDEMNMSHVERYFADFLSVIESGEKLQFHRAAGNSGTIDGVPEAISLPENLFVVGTVNVDETTYLFSPKVLDRANSIEFRVNETQMVGFLDTPNGADLSALDGRGRKFGRSFVAEARGVATPMLSLRFKAEMTLLFRILADHGVEFGFRTAKEVARFVEFHQRLSSIDWAIDDAMDAQICQKVLPKLHGSRRKLEPILCALGILCWRVHQWDETKANADPENPLAGLVNAEELLAEARQAAALEDEHLYPLNATFPEKGIDDTFDKTSTGATPRYPISLDKIRRMLSRAVFEGFASFAEA